MIDGTRRVEFHNVEVLSANLLLRCRVNDRVVNVPPLRMLPGSTIRHAGDRGLLILPLDVAEDLDLA